MQGWIAWLLAFLMAPGALHAAPQEAPLRLAELDLLLLAGVAPEAFSETVEKRGLAFPDTPAIRRFLESRGLAADRVEALLAKPGGAEPALPLEELGDSGLLLPVPEGWSFEGERGSWRLVHPRTPPAFRLQVEFRTFRLAGSIIEGREPELLTLQDEMRRQLEPYEKTYGYELIDLEPLPARGLTGVRARLRRARAGEARASVVLGLYQPGAQLLVVRAFLEGEPEDPFAKEVHATIESLLTGVSTRAAAGEEPARAATRILALVPGQDGRRLLLLDRAGRELEVLAEGTLRGLSGDPLALRAAWFEGAELQLLSDLGVRPGEVPPEAGSEPGLVLLPGREQPLLCPWSETLGSWRLPGPERVHILPLGEVHAMPAGDRILHCGPDVTPGSLGVRLAPVGEGASRAPEQAHFRPATRVDAVADPASRHLLCAAAGTHFSIPWSSASEPTSVGRLVYVPLGEGSSRTLLLRSRPGADQPVIGAPRFTPSGHEVLFLDPERGLCVMPRAGGLPVVLRAPQVLAMNPWLDLR